MTLEPESRRLTMSLRMACCGVMVCCAVAGASEHLPAAEPQLPKVVLLGDSIRMGYAPLVAQRLAGRATVISSAANGGDSANLLKKLEEMALREKPMVVHFNCGLHDLKIARKTGKQQASVDQYAANLRRLVGRLQKETTAGIVFANTTPVLDARRSKWPGEYELRGADVLRYNAAAVAAMKECGVPVHDLHWAVEQAGLEKVLGPDGVHYTPEGKARLAEAVADAVLRQLAITRFPGTLPKGPSAEEAARYAKAQAERDAQVPAAFKRLPVPPFQVPENAAAWRLRRPAVLQAVTQSLGDLPPRPSPQRVRVVSRELRRGYTLERVAIDNGQHGEVSALVLVPEKRRQPAPAILWLHSSTPDKNQLLTPNTNGGVQPLGEAFIDAGYVVVAPDSYSYGNRADETVGGPLEAYRRELPATYRWAEDSMVKFNLWFGRTLWGMMVRDDQIALDYLCSRPEVDQQRIGATGMSMGSTRSWWLAAVDERVSAAVGVACLTRYQNLIAHGELRAHGIYYFVFGLLKHCDTEAVIALIAPRPFLALTGDLDRGSPADGIRDIERLAGGVYRANGAPEHFQSVLYRDTGHVYSADMRTKMLAWFDRWLKPAK
jgi:dienelactone hydrolase/lysophospholipase L1-like esterase